MILISSLASSPQEEQTELCMFDTRYEAFGPFLTGQWSVFVPTDKYQKSMSWILSRRGELDIFIHPNTGCSTLDHTTSAQWAGNKWELDTSIFSS